MGEQFLLFDSIRVDMINTAENWTFSMLENAHSEALIRIDFAGSENAIIQIENISLIVLNLWHSFTSTLFFLVSQFCNS